MKSSQKKWKASFSGNSKALAEAIDYMFNHHQEYDPKQIAVIFNRHYAMKR